SLAAQIRCLLAWRRSGLPSGADVRRAGTRAIAFGLAVVAAAVVPLAALRAYQQRTLRATFTDRLAAAHVPVTVTDEPAADARVIVETETLPADREADATIGAVTTEYLVARVGGDRCEVLRVPITLRY